MAIITLAPELDYPAGYPVIKECTKRGLIISIGHSEATLETAELAVRAGASMVTHLFNAMNGFHHRADPGFLGLLELEDQKLFYGIISDGIHANPQALKMAYRANKNGMVLVSDAISAMGLKPGEKCWYGQHEIELKNSKAVICGTDILCGASTSIYHCMMNLIEFT